MKQKLFFREFIGNKKIVFFLAIALVVSFYLSGFEFIYYEASVDNGYRPDVYMNGTISPNVFAYYNDVEKAIEYVNSNSEEAIKAIPCVTRNIISCSEKNKFNKVNYTIKGYSSEYIQDSLAQYIVEGRLPEQGKNEVIIGRKFADAMHLSLGDKIEGQPVELGTIGEILLFISLEEEPTIDGLAAYSVCGIISDNCSFLDYSAVVIADDSFKPNTIELFFASSNAPSIYRNLLEKMPENMLGGVSEFYEEIREQATSLLMSAAAIAIAIVLIIYLLISLLLKGLNKKLSVMKAIGLTDRYIISSFWGGIVVMILAAVAISAGLLAITVGYLNKQYSAFIGAEAQKFQFGFLLILFLIAMGLYISMNLWVILKVKIAKVNPKIDL